MHILEALNLGGNHKHLLYTVDIDVSGMRIILKMNCTKRCGMRSQKILEN